MSRTIDRRVVEMKFDNKQFESAVNQSRQSIQLMEKDLKLLEGARALTNLDKTISSVDFTRMVRGIDSVKGAFSTLGVVGRSVVNKLTTDAMNSMQAMANGMKSKIEGLFKEVEQRGFRRASNLENSTFKIQGLLKRSNLDLEESDRVRARLSEMISDSVNDTAFGLDSATVAASTLASTFGTSEAGLANINKSLSAIAGVAGTTGAAYEQVADIFTDVAGKGKAQALEFNRLSLLGINAQQEVANYINKDVKLRGKLNKILKENTKHLITAADVSELAGKKGAITADIFSDAFQGFIETAKEANNTLDGVTANIGAAIGRLGALFAQPLIQNEGPYVKFLQVVKDGISSFAKILDNLKIPKMVTDFFNDVIVDGTEHLKTFIDEFKKGATPLNDFLEKLSTIIRKLKTIISLRGETINDNRMSKGGQQYKYLSDEMEANKSAMEFIRKNSKSYGKTISDYETAIKKKHKNWSKEKREREAERQFMSDWNKNEYHSLNQWKEHYTKSFEDAYKKEHKIRGEGTKKQKEALEKYMSSSEVKSQIALKSQMKYNATVDKALKTTGQYDKALANVQQRMEETSIFGFDYLGEFIQGFKNILKGVGNIFKTLADAVIGTSGPLHDFFNMLSGGDEETKDSRKSLNKFSTDFKEMTERFIDFTKNNKGFKDIITVIGKAFVIITKIVSGVNKILGRTLIAFAPLLSKIIDALGRVFGIFDDGTKEVSLFDDIIEAICVVLESLAKVLEWVWDTGSKAFNWIKDTSIGAGIGALLKGIISFVKYVIDNWPEIWGTITNGVKGFVSAAKPYVSMVKDKLQPVIEKISPYLETFATKVKDLTNGFIDLEKPVEFIKNLFGGKSDGLVDAAGKTEEALDKVDTKVKNVKDGIKELTDKSNFGAVGDGGFLKGRMGMLAAPSIDTSSLLGSVPEMSQEETKNAEEGLNNTSSFLTTLSNIASNIKNNVNPNVITGALGIIGTVAVAIAGLVKFKTFKKNIEVAFNGFVQTGKALAGGFQNITDVFKENAEAQKQLAKAENTKATVKLVLAIIAGIAAMAAVVFIFYKMAQKDAAALWQGIGAFVIIAVILGALIIVISRFAARLTGSSSEDIDNEFGFAGPKGISIKHGDKVKRDVKESAFKPLIAIAAVIGVFAAGVLAIAGSIKLLGTMNPDELREGFNTFIKIGAMMIGLVLIAMIFTMRILENDKSNSEALAKNVALMFVGVAAIIYAFAGAITKIALAMKVIALLPQSFMGQVGPMFNAIGFCLVGLVAVVLLITALILKNAKGNEEGLAKNLFFVLLGVAVILMAFAKAVKTILKALSNVMIVSKFTKASSLKTSIEILKTTMTSMAAIVAIVMLFTAIFMGVASGDAGKMKSIMGILAIIGVVMLMLGKAIQWAMKGISVIIKAVANASAKQLNAAADMIGSVLMALVIIVVAILAFVGVMAATNLINGKTIGMLFALAGLFTVLGALILVVAYAAKMFGDVGVEQLETFKTSMWILGAILAGLMIFAGVAGNVPGMMKGIILVSALMLALGTMFALIGAAVLMVGKGVDLLLGSIQKLAMGIMLFAKMKDTTILKGGAKLGKAFKTVLLALVDGVIEFGKEVESKRDALNNAVGVIFGIIGDAINTAIDRITQNILTRLGILIDIIGPWLIEYTPKLITIFQQLESILWDGILEPFFTDLGTYLYDKILWVGDYLLENKQTIIDNLINFGTQMMVGLAQGIEDNKKKITTAIWILLKSVCNILFSFLGLPEPFPEVKEQIDKFKKGVYDMGESVDDQFADGVDKGYDTVKDGIESFCSKVGQAIWDGLKENELIKKAGEWLGNKVYEFMHPWETSEYKQALDKKEGWEKIKEIQAVEVQMRVNLYKAGKSASEADQLARDWALKQISAIKKAYGIESPSKVMQDDIAKNINLGLQNGLVEYGKATVSTAYKEATHINSAFDAALNSKTMSEKVSKNTYMTLKDLGSNLASNFKNSMTKVQKVIEDSGLFDPSNFVIKPSLDLSNITKDTDKMQGLFDKVGLGNVNAASTVGLFDALKSGNTNNLDISGIANGFDSANSKSPSNSNSSNTPTSINFTQNNYSPESLSQIDIYRQTENLLGKKSTLNSLASSVGLTGTNF